uniref:Phosvitin n=1 Tax=Otus sunia TaxID=257818 RepID=A0A8C8AX48_9STRI
MRGLILLLVLTLVEPDFSENKVYTFNYESVLLSGLPEKGLARAGIRIKSKVEISGIGPKLSAEYNGVWPTSSFSRSLKLTQVLTGQLSNPIKFEYSSGHVGNLMAPDSVSDDGLNIYRGVLNVLELSIKKMQHSYSLQEAGIGGICNTTYAIQENKKASLVYVTKSKDLNSCEEKVQMVTGSAYTHPCQTCQNSRTTATYNYKIKYTHNEAVITQADVEEIHQFAPFNEITGGNAIVEARQKLVLTDVQKHMAEVPPKEFQNRGSLQYQFGSELLQLPVHLFRIKNVESQIEESLQDLVETTSERLPSDAPAKALKLMHLLRVANEENYESVWKQFSSRPAYRRYILDIIPAVSSHHALRFLRHKMERQELTNWEAAQTVLVALHSSTPTRDLIMKKHCPRSSTVLGKVCHLSYASLCHKQCSSSDSCSECLQLLHGFAGEALSKSNTEEIFLALKALGNVGHPASIKHIKKFLPGYAAGASDLPLKVHATAVMALKNIGVKDPKMVQAITLEIFLNHKINPRIRMLAAVVLLETKPGLPIVTTLADAVLKEPSMQVASFIYSYLRALGRSTVLMCSPNFFRASACRMAIRVLSPRFDISGYRFSKVFRFSIFKGKIQKILLRNIYRSIFIPTMAISQLRTHFLGRVADPLEVGIMVEGLQEMFAKRYSPDRVWETDYGLKEILKTLSDWKAFSSDKPFASGYLKMFGQELFFGGLDKNAIQNALLISSLQSGVGKQWTKALLSSEIRRIVPTCTGFPTETSFYYSSVTKITPSPKSDFRLPELLNANIRLRSKMSLSMAKEMTFVMGINTHMIQAGLEAHTEVNAHVPVNVVATVHMKEKNIKIEIPPCKDETNIITVRKSRSSSSSASSTSGSAKSTASSPSSSDSDNRASRGDTQINLKARRSKVEGRKFYPFGDSGISSSSSSSGSSSSSKSSSSSSSSKSKSSSSSSSSSSTSKSSSSSSSSSTSKSSSSSSSSSTSKSSSSSSKSSSSNSSSSKSSSSRSSKGSRSSSTGSINSRSSRASSIKHKAKKQSKTTPFSHASAAEGERSVREQKHKTQSSSSGTSSGTNSSSESSSASYRHRKYDRQAETKNVKSQFNSHGSHDISTEWVKFSNALATARRLRWGKECRDYRIAAMATTGQLARKPAVQLKVQWGNLPSWIKKTSTAFMQYVPGAALVLGFSEAHQRNPSHEFIVRAAATSPRTIDTVIKAPGITLYYQALRMPFTLPLGPSPTYKTRDITAWNLFPEIASQIAQEDQSTCEVSEGDFKTFDHVSHTYSFNKSCNLIVVQDCTEHPKFIITTRKVDPQNITIYPAANSSLLVAYSVKIYKNGTTVIVEVPTHGLKNVTFDGVILKYSLQRKTCGVCGNNDREKHNELLMPNHKLAHSCSAFVHSWVLLEETCSSGCKLQRSYVKLNRNPTIDGEESMCYSVDPVLKCMKDCTPIEKASVKVGFHCFPKGMIFFSLCVTYCRSSAGGVSTEVIHTVC